ncbi:MAG: glycosyltransferase family 2 protein [Candidatus Uhrbacteria bacterium]|nr:glycosyltransferase family 2 protein [Candidatus Uhrbacteria bacterium]
MMHVSVNILTWNDLRYLPELFASLKAQTHADMTVRVLDNGSNDGTVAYIMQHHPHWLAVRNTKNQGFAGGHNQLVRIALERYQGDPADHAILLVNADMILAPNLIEELVRALDEHGDVDAVQPKILRAFAERGEIDVDSTKSDILDTTGIVVHKGWRMADRGAGEMDRGQYDQLTDIFAPTGTMMLVRATALADVLINGEMFDGDFFAYREDCDFAWRFRRAGHRSRFVPTAKVHHYRGMYGEAKRGLLKRLFDRRKQRPFFAALSTRNQLLTLMKNLTLVDAFLAAPWMSFHEGGRVLYGFVFEPETRKALLKAPLLVFRMLRKRKQVMALARVPGSELRAYVS